MTDPNLRRQLELHDPVGLSPGETGQSLVRRFERAVRRTYRRSKYPERLSHCPRPRCTKEQERSDVGRLQHGSLEDRARILQPGGGLLQQMFLIQLCFRRRLSWIPPRRRDQSSVAGGKAGIPEGSSNCLPLAANSSTTEVVIEAVGLFQPKPQSVWCIAMRIHLPRIVRATLR